MFRPHLRRRHPEGRVEAVWPDPSPLDGWWRTVMSDIDAAFDGDAEDPHGVDRD